MILALRLLILLLIFLTPLLSNFVGLDYEQSKVGFFLLSIFPTALIWCVYLFKYRRQVAFKFSFLDGSIGLFLIILVLTSLTGLSFEDSLIGHGPYFQGLILYLSCFLLYLIVSTINLNLTNFSQALVGSACLVSLKSLIQTLPGTFQARPVSSFGQADLYAGFLILALPFTIYLYQKSQNVFSKVAMVLAMTTISLGVIVSQSRVGLILIGISGGIGMIRHLRSKVGLIIWPGVILMAFLGVLLAFQVIESDWKMPQSQQWLIDNSPEKRLYIWPAVVSLIQVQPVKGYGLDNLELIFKDFVPESVPKMAYFGVKNLSIDRAHSYILDLLIDGGVSLLLSWLLIYVMAIKSVRSQVLLQFLILYFIWIELEVQSLVLLIMFWAVLGVIKSQPK